MRTIATIPNIPKNTDVTKFPDSTIINETDTDEGTPVVEEIYGDVLTNIYNLLRITKETPTGIQDNELNGYQLVRALRKLTNTLNDTEQQLNLTGNQFSINIDLSLLPNKYFFFARAVEANVASTVYTFKGSGTTVYDFQAVNNFVSGDEILLIIDQSKVRAYNLSGQAQALDVFTPFGTPLAYNNGSKVWYQSEGILFSDSPESYDIQGSIRLFESDGTVIVYEMTLVNGFVLCLCFFPNTLTYKLYKVSLANVSAPIPIVMSGGAFPVGTDNKPNIYVDGSTVFITNNTGTTANNYSFDIYNLDIAAGTVTYSGMASIDSGFEKTTNAVIQANNIFTFIAGVLKRYNIGTGTATYIASYPTYIGVIFKINGLVYYSNGEVAKKWTLPV